MLDTVKCFLRCRGIAQFGSVLGSGPRGRGFKSRYSDQWQKATAKNALTLVGAFFLFFFHLFTKQAWIFLIYPPIMNGYLPVSALADGQNPTVQEE